jgi:carbonic anhydrase
MLNPLNEIEMDNLKSFINFKKCTKIIIAGHHHCRALEYIRCEVNAESPIFNLRETLRELYGNNHGSLITKWHGETMLTELNVIEQCKKLMTLPFVREKFENGEIGVLGVIIFRHGEIKKVFNNGIAYNDVISLN